MKANGKKLTTLLVTLGFFASLLVAMGPAGAAGGRAPEFGVTVSFEQAGQAATAYDVNNGGNLTIKLAVTNSGDNTTTATVVLGYDDELDGLYEGELKTWTPQTLNNDTSTELTFTLEPFLVEYLFIFPMYKPMIWVNVSDVNATSFNQTFNVPSKIAMPQVGEVLATSTNANSSLVILGVDKLDMSVNITAFADGKDLTGKVDFYLDDPMGDPIQTVDISPAMANDTSMIFEVQGFDLSTLATAPTFGTHVIYVMASDGVLSNENVSAEFTVAEAMANVVVESVTVSAASGMEGTSVTFTAKVNNTGTLYNETVVDFYDGTNKLGNSTMVNISVGMPQDVTFVWTLPDVAADTTKTVTAKVGASSAWVNVTIVAKVAKINITAFSVPDGMKIGDVKNLTATVKNEGTGDATGVVVEFYDGTVKLVASAPFNLTAGSSQDVSLAVTLAGTADANHTFFVKASGAEKNATKMIGHKLSAASVGITSFKVAPAKKDKQPQDSTQSFTLTVSMKNSGETKTSNCTLTIKEGSKTLFTESIALEPNQTVTKTYTWKVKGSGGHTAVASLAGADAGTPATMTTKCTLEYTPGFEVLLLVAAIVVAAMLVRRRKN